MVGLAGKRFSKAPNQISHSPTFFSFSPFLSFFLLSTPPATLQSHHQRFLALHHRLLAVTKHRPNPRYSSSLFLCFLFAVTPPYNTSSLPPLEPRHCQSSPKLPPQLAATHISLLPSSLPLFLSINFFLPSTTLHHYLCFPPRYYAANEEEQSLAAVEKKEQRDNPLFLDYRKSQLPLLASAFSTIVKTFSRHSNTTAPPYHHCKMAPYQ